MRTVSTALCAVLAFSAPAFAEDMTRQEWDGLRKRYSKIARRHENISHCTAVFSEKLQAPDIAELEEDIGAKGVEAIADFCAAFVMGVGDGSITYEHVARRNSGSSWSA